MTLIEGRFLYTGIFREIFREVCIVVCRWLEEKNIYLTHTSIETTILDRYDDRHFLMGESIKIIGDQYDKRIY